MCDVAPEAAPVRQASAEDVGVHDGRVEEQERAHRRETVREGRERAGVAGRGGRRRPASAMPQRQRGQEHQPEFGKAPQEVERIAASAHVHDQVPGISRGEIGILTRSQTAAYQLSHARQAEHRISPALASPVAPVSTRPGGGHGKPEKVS